MIKLIMQMQIKPQIEPAPAVEEPKKQPIKIKPAKKKTLVEPAQVQEPVQAEPTQAEPPAIVKKLGPTLKLSLKKITNA